MDFTENQRFEFNREYTDLWILHETPRSAFPDSAHRFKKCANRQRDTTTNFVRKCIQLPWQNESGPLLRRRTLAPPMSHRRRYSLRYAFSFSDL